MILHSVRGNRSQAFIRRHLEIYTNMKDVIDVLELQGQREKHRKLIDYRTQEGTYMGVRFIFECGLKLKVTSSTMSCAAYIFHEFFREANIKNYDMYHIGITCLYMASKLNDDSLKLRDIINVAHSTLLRSSSPLELSDKYWAMRDAIVQAELLIMRMIKFKLNVNNPVKYLLLYLRSLKGWLHPADWKEAPLIHGAMSFLMDFHHDSAILEYKQEHLAIACLFLALQCYGVPVPHVSEDEGSSWFSAFDSEATKDKVWEISEKIMDCYDKDS